MGDPFNVHAIQQETAMHFWRIDLLKQQLTSQGLTEKQIYYYILISAALSSIGEEIGRYLPHESIGFWTHVNSHLKIVITIIGTTVIFRANGGTSGTQFAARYFSIGLVASIRFTVLFFPLMMILMMIQVVAEIIFTGEVMGELSIAVTDIALIIWSIVLYAYIAKQVYEVAKGNSITTKVRSCKRSAATI